MAENFKDLSEQEILTLAISLEETDARIYADFAAGLRADYPTTVKIFEEMEAEEDEHRGKLIEEYRRRWRTHSFDSSRRRKGVRAPQTGVDVELRKRKPIADCSFCKSCSPGWLD